MNEIPGFFDYVTPAGVQLARGNALGSATGYAQSYADARDFPTQFGYPGNPGSVDLTYGPGGVGGEFAVSLPPSGFVARHRWDADDIGGYYAPGAFQGTEIFQPGQPGGPWFPVDTSSGFFAGYGEPTEWANTARTIANQAGGYNQAVGGYDAVIAGLDNVDNWNSIAQGAYDRATDPAQYGTALTDLRVALARRGLTGTNYEQAALRQLQGTEGIADIVRNALGYMQNLRSADYNDSLFSLNNDLVSARAGSATDNDASYYANQADTAEANNLVNAQNYIQNIDLSAPLAGLIQRISRTPAPDPTVGGGGLGAYLDELASPSGITQELPRDQEFQGTFDTGDTKPYKGRT